MVRDVSIMIAGDGVLFTGSILAKILKRQGGEINTRRDDPSNPSHPADPAWCPDCVIFGFFAALKKAAFSLRYSPSPWRSGSPDKLLEKFE